MQINGRGVLAENSDGIATVDSGTTTITANSGQGAYGNNYVVVVVDDGISPTSDLSSDGKTLTININGVSDVNSWQTFLDNTGLPPGDVPDQVGAAPSTLGVWFEYDGTPVVGTYQLSGGQDNNVTPIRWAGGVGRIVISAAVYNGDTIAMFQVSPHGTSIPIKDVFGNLVSVTADGQFDVDLPPGEINVTYSAATGVYAYIIGNHQGGV